MQEKAAVGVVLLMSKGRLAPLKQLTIPRLELAGAYTSVQLDVYLRDTISIPITASWFWTDSTIVLCYIFNLFKRFLTWIANRVSFIHEHSKTVQWRHIPTSINPADILSRGATVEELENSYLWKHGPAFLLQSEEHWPEMPGGIHKQEDKLEVKKDVPHEYCNYTKQCKDANHGTCPKATPAEPFGRLYDHYSTWYRLCRSIVYLVKLYRLYRLKLLHEKGRAGHPRKYVSMVTTADEIKRAEYGLIKTLQRKFYDNPDPATRKQYRKTFPIVEDGLIRVGGRLHKANLHPHARHPILLPAGQPACALLLEYHYKLGHANAQRILQEMSGKYWIVHGGREMKITLGRCVLCKTMTARLRAPIMSALPAGRVVGDKPPFSIAGVDYFGPLHVRQGRSTVKRYGCLFTCFLTRGVHIEVAFTLNVDSCLLAIQRLAHRRGMPEEMHSDNGPNFVNADRVLCRMRDLWNQQQIADELKKKGCKWVFNTPLASHQGGVWERLIRSVKTILMNVAGRREFTDESLYTFLTLIEDVLNGRPITPVSKNPTDLSALSPNHLLRPKTDVVLPTHVTEESDQYRRRWMMVQYLGDIFWSRWKVEYLPTLQLRHKWYKNERNLRVGDLVIVKEEYFPRNHWPMGRILRVFPGDDGVVRNVEVRTTRGVYRRPVQKLCLLEGVG